MSGYIGPQPVPQATQHRGAFTATASQTSFATVGYTPQFIDVYLNGIKLASEDYTATNGSDVVLTTGAAASDILEYVAYTPFEVANQTFTGTTTTDALTVTGAFTSKGIDDNATSTAITIDASENVGIGGTLASWSGVARVLEFGGQATDYIGFNSATSGYIYQNAYYDGTNNVYKNTGLASAYGQASGVHSWFGAASGTGGAIASLAEHMRIDTSGNVLVGKVANDLTTQGTRIRSNALDTSRDSSAALNVNRNGTDGDMALFYKAGAVVGAVGTNAGGLTVGSYDTGLRFADTIDSIIPFNLATGSDRGEAVDLGYPSVNTTFKNLYLSGGVNGAFFTKSGQAGIKIGGLAVNPCDSSGGDLDNYADLGAASNRWKDAYLSGGVFLGGTGAANKLDDYEEGTWTPTTTSGGFSLSNKAIYTKVGRLVHVTSSLQYTGSGTAATSSDVSGLPFAISAGCAPGVSIRYTNIGSFFTGHGDSGTTSLQWYFPSGGPVTYGNFGAGRVDWSLSYETDA
jgi:hypothetical protein